MWGADLLVVLVKQLKAGIPLDHYQDTSQVCTISKRFSRLVLLNDAMNSLITCMLFRKLYTVALVLSLVISWIDFVFNDADIIEERTLISLIGHQRLQGEESIIQEKLFLSHKVYRRRPFTGHAGPTGGDFPLITREGHNVLDVIFTSPILDLVEVANTLENIDGVVDHGVISKIP
ncbi:hypothetical protein HYC85_018946 [Camellia sinensis]|uniref:Uncharacterized protein n=1 Tax=Camellia sinensis TaxID=4442 RepID=A0A7J7GVT0_CAMSI|nr:hypothetical protein HYC85_018946 [Camellia sinensis]